MNTYNPAEVEHEVQKFWDKNKIYEKQKAKYAKSKRRWSFIDGPITANNPMGVHHAWGRTLKDIFLRFRAAQRYNIRRQNGFDCQGLWIEVEVEKEKGLKSTKDIEEFGIDNFVKACKERTERMAKKQTEQSIRLGQWMDWDNSYYTHSFTANDYKWWFIKLCHEKGWLYKGKDVVPWCPRCSVVESKHAIATEGYWDEKDKAIFMKFPIEGKEKEYLLVWTTTPWTLPADVAVAANPNIYYVRAEKDGEVYILAEKLVEKALGKANILDKFIGMDLEGFRYVMPYADLPAQKSSIMSGAKSEDDVGSAPHTVVMWDLVSEEDGTGLVHIAPGCGPEDYQLGISERLPAPSPLDKEGKYQEGYGWLTGKLSRDMNAEVIADMKKRGFIYKVEEYVHRYPHCTRCKTPLVFRLVPEWYISMDALRQPCMDANKTINWVPPQGKSYEKTWLENMGDWLFSRKRFYGLAMPIWECECGHYDVIGSAKELKEKASEGIKYFTEHRRPGVDKVKVKCFNCGKSMSRVPDTVDVWMDAGMVPFYTLDYFNNKDEFNKWFPADFVAECGPGQYRCWFFFMLLHSVAITGKAPFKNILTDELVKDEKGQEMHKSSGNAIWFDEAAEKVGADIMRWQYSKQDPAKELWFGWNSLGEEFKSLNVLWNFANYAGANIKPKKPARFGPESQWVLSRLESLKEKVTSHLENYESYLAALAIEDFYLNVLSRGYGQMIREDDSAEVKYVLYTSLLDVLKLLSPFVPFFTEKVYQEIYGKKAGEESIHLFEWPKVNTRLINKKLEKQFVVVQEVISSTLAARAQMQRGIRWPVKSVNVVTADKSIKDAVNKYAALIKSMTNTTELKVSESMLQGKLIIKPNYAVLGKKIGSKIKEVAKLLEKVSGIPKNLTVDGEKIELAKEDLIVQEVVPEGLFSMQGTNFTIYLDKQENDAMLSSGYSREVVRKVQDLRKKTGLVKKDKITLIISSSVDLDLKEIQKKVGAKKISVGKVSGKHKEKFTVRDKSFEIGF